MVVLGVLLGFSEDRTRTRAVIVAGFGIIGVVDVGGGVVRVYRTGSGVSGWALSVRRVGAVVRRF